MKEYYIIQWDPNGEYEPDILDFNDLSKAKSKFKELKQKLIKGETITLVEVIEDAWI